MAGAHFNFPGFFMVLVLGKIGKMGNFKNPSPLGKTWKSFEEESPLFVMKCEIINHPILPVTSSDLMK